MTARAYARARARERERERERERGNLAVLDSNSGPRTYMGVHGTLKEHDLGAG